jgi:hypothetical protein
MKTAEPGDCVAVRGRVITTAPAGVTLRIKRADGAESYVPVAVSEIVGASSVDVLPATLGMPVESVGCPGQYRLIGVDGDAAWLRAADGRRIERPAASVRKASV